ncbi:MAG: hypothetical protein AAFV45_10970 [Pseudomonadota bacterium]
MVAASKPRLPNVVYCTASNRIIDLIRKSEHHADAIARLEGDYGAALVALPYEAAEARHEAAFKSEPIRITQEQWIEALEVLPPKHWHNTGAGESFKSIEHLTGNITAIYVALDGEYFTFDDTAALSHSDCVARVRAWLEQEAKLDATD